MGSTSKLKLKLAIGFLGPGSCFNSGISDTYVQSAPLCSPTFRARACVVHCLCMQHPPCSTAFETHTLWQFHSRAHALWRCYGKGPHVIHNYSVHARTRTPPTRIRASATRTRTRNPFGNLSVLLCIGGIPISHYHMMLNYNARVSLHAPVSHALAGTATGQCL